MCVRKNTKEQEGDVMPYKARQIKRKKLLSKRMKIPKTFINHPLISQVLRLTVHEFNAEEQAIIYLYCLIKLPVNEIAELTELSSSHVASILELYFEKLAFKLNVFKKAVHYDTTELVSVGEMFEAGCERG